MLARARQMAHGGDTRSTFMLADATVYPFDPGNCDLIGLAVRRDVFRPAGVFPLPQYAPGRCGAQGRLTFACWREAAR